MADQPLSSANHRRLGGPLPHQLPNGTQARLQAPQFFPLYHAVVWAYAVLHSVSRNYPPLEGWLLTRYSPVRHFPLEEVNFFSILVRLACVKHAASVRPEPGSNSSTIYCYV